MRVHGKLIYLTCVTAGVLHNFLHNIISETVRRKCTSISELRYDFLNVSSHSETSNGETGSVEGAAAANQNQGKALSS